MIHKIEKLVSIGKFRDYQAVDDVSFRKLTLIYADNGTGKTTLTAILRSLTQNKPEIIFNRISINPASPQSAQIIQRDITGHDTFYTFRTTGWSSPFPNIEIFDIHFVNENIYSGFDFNDEHKKQLHEFVIGAQGVAIKQQIEQNKIDKTALRLRISNAENDIIELVGNGINTADMAAFINLSVDQAENINERIEVAEDALTHAKANAVIQTLQPLLMMNSVNAGIDFEAIRDDLETNTDAIQDMALNAVFNNHCEELIQNQVIGAETWLQTGYKYLLNKNNFADAEEPFILTCPFCQQPINNTLDIIRSYTLRFNEEFNTFVQRIQIHLTNLQNFNLDANIQSISNTQQTNASRVNSWSTHLPAHVQIPVFDIITDETTLRDEFQDLIAKVNQKLQNPSILMVADAVTIFQSSIQNINTNIVTNNQNVTSYNYSITTFLAGIQTEQQAQEEVNRLKRIKKRFEPAINVLCTTVVTEKQNLRILEQAYTQLSQQEQSAAAAFFVHYKDRINHYLGQVFNTPFKIDNVVHVPPQGRATQSKIGYKLKIDDQDISFDSNQPNSVKDCLSEGDKSTIALAFFLAKMDIDPGLTDKVLVFDDPLSSFDKNRRLYTVQLIKDLFPQIKQIIVLSHDEHFLHELSKSFARGDKKTLRISENFVAKASKIEPLNLDALVENKYFKHINELEEFLQNADINEKDKILGYMRNILEAHIRFKFYRQTLVIPENSRTFGRLISELVNHNVIFRDNANAPSIINKLRLINAVSCKPHHGEPEPDYRAIGIDPDTITVAELANLVRDTLNLIDNQL
jgi:wobble nucleotide-excising tRNase